MNFRLLPLVALLTTTAHASLRGSVNYAVATDSADAGGKRATSASYTNDGSAGGVVGISTFALPSETVKHGFIAQLYETAGLTLTAAAPTVDEGTTDQLGAWLALDDATFLAIPATSITWSVQSGPLSGINSSGLATAATVYQNTAATAQGIYLGQTGTLGLTVLDSIADNFGSYAGDSLSDDWQVQYFGLNNSNAAPALDPDGDGQSNLFEFTAGLNPVSGVSRFLLHNAKVPNQPGQMDIVISPVVAGRTYTVEASPTLGAGAVWNDLTSFSTSDNGTIRTITDLDATGLRKFYRVEIVGP